LAAKDNGNRKSEKTHQGVAIVAQNQCNTGCIRRSRSEELVGGDVAGKGHRNFE